MMKMQKILRTLMGVTLVLGYGSVQAVPITGSLWKVPSSIAGNAIPANVPGTIPDVVFDVNAPLNFSGVGLTVGGWLATGSAFNIVENTPGVLASTFGDFTTGSILNFIGSVSVTNGQTFSVTHDDGLTLIIGGLDLGFNPGPTPPITSVITYTGPTGNFPFQLVYGDIGGQQVLQVSLPFTPAPPPTSVPEPGSLLLLGCGLIGLLGFKNHKNRWGQTRLI